MNIFSIITLIGGLAFFLYGMTVMSTSLEKMSGSKLESALKSMTSNPFKSLLFGAGVTIAVQSSSALTVMLVGLVNSGIMSLKQTVGIIMGSNIGTTLTAWILSLAGIESTNLFIQLLQPDSFAPIAAFIGVILIMASKKSKNRDIGGILVGFAILMFGMDLMSGAVKPLADMPEFASILTAFNNPILGVIVGTVFTGIIQSSAASVGILQALSLTGAISFRMALPIIMGQNIGTCVTAIISSIGVNRNAKRVSVVHIAFNLIGTIICMVLFYGSDMLFNFTFMDSAISPVLIAVCHSIFNILTTLMLLPFGNTLVKIAEKVIPESNKKEEYSFLDARILNTPSIAIEECYNLTKKMAVIAKQQISSACQLTDHFDEKKAVELDEVELELDMYEDKLGSALVQLSRNELSDKDSQQVFKLLHIIGDYERIGDHASNITKIVRDMNKKDIHFSTSAQKDILVICHAIERVLEMTVDAYNDNNIEAAVMIEPLEEVVDHLVHQMKKRHIKRLQQGECTMELGYVLSDLLNNFERASDHCSNIAVAMIEISQNAFDTHEYLNSMRSKDNPLFQAKVKEFKEIYSLH